MWGCGLPYQNAKYTIMNYFFVFSDSKKLYFCQHIENFVLEIINN